MRNVLALLLLLLLVAPAGAADPTAEAARLYRSNQAERRIEAVRLLRSAPGRTAIRLLLHALTDEDAEVRFAARRAVGDRRAEEDLQAIRDDGLSHADPRVRRASLEELAAAAVPDLVDLLPGLLEDRDPEVREAAVGVVASELGVQDLDLLAAAADRGREGRPRAAALLALREFAPEKARELAVSLRSFPAFEVRVACATILAGGPPESAVPFLAGLLTDENWSVRLAAGRALVALRTAPCVPPLIDALSREHGRMKEEVAGALAAITGVGLPADPERWREWWAREGADFQPSERPAAPVLEQAGASVATFHSIPVLSDGIAFVLDRSGSMRGRVVRKGEEEITKAKLVEAELARTLSKLTERTLVHLVAFGDEPAEFLPKPVRATSAVARRAADWFAKREPAGRTNLYDSLVLALRQPEVDTIFVLTDGAPSTGEERNRRDILDAIARENRYRQAVIHTVEIGGETTGKRWEGFLADLARRHGGIHVRR